MTTTIDTETLPTQIDAALGGAPSERLFAELQPEAVFGEPVASGPYTVITAREVSMGGGFGFGGGFGPSPTTSEGTAPQTTVAGGKASGGGGGSIGRPVAVIIIGPDGVKVKPIVDVTKVMLTGITVSRAVATLFGKLRLLRKSKS